MLLEDKAIFSGDCVLGCGTTVFDNLKQYMDSLNHLKSIITKENIVMIYPGHGPIIVDALGKVTDYINHRQFREDAIVSILMNDKRWFSSYELVDIVYAKENLAFFVKFSAQYNISHVLNKLVEEKKVTYKTPGLYKFNL
jgi:glyoxylase-like metal-dependent hydrolase (beta-lactamase superfamily II)